MGVRTRKSHLSVIGGGKKKKEQSWKWLNLGIFMHIVKYLCGGVFTFLSSRKK